jgi:hypothetical protein
LIQHSSKARQIGISPISGPVDIVKKEDKEMATQNDLRAVAGKALADPDFRQKLIDDPEAAVKEAGIALTDGQMEALRQMDREQFERGIGELDQRLTMSCWGRRSIIGPIDSPDAESGVIDSSQLKGWHIDPPDHPDPSAVVRPCGWD